jgi:hypothetical protein
MLTLQMSSSDDTKLLTRQEKTLELSFIGK